MVRYVRNYSQLRLDRLAVVIENSNQTISLALVGFPCQKLDCISDYAREPTVDTGSRRVNWSLTFAGGNDTKR